VHFAVNMSGVKGAIGVPDSRYLHFTQGDGLRGPDAYLLVLIAACQHRREIMKYREKPRRLVTFPETI